MNFVLLVVILVTVMLAALAQLTLKLGVGAISACAGANGVGSPLLSAAAGLPLIWLGMAIYVIPLLAWL